MMMMMMIMTETGRVGVTETGRDSSEKKDYYKIEKRSG